MHESVLGCTSKDAWAHGTAEPAGGAERSARSPDHGHNEEVASLPGKTAEMVALWEEEFSRHIKVPRFHSVAKGSKWDIIWKVHAQQAHRLCLNISESNSRRQSAVRQGHGHLSKAFRGNVLLVPTREASQSEVVTSTQVVSVVE